MIKYVFTRETISEDLKNIATESIHINKYDFDFIVKALYAVSGQYKGALKISQARELAKKLETIY